MSLRLDTNILSELRKGATALVHGLVLMTRNLRDFERVPRLRLRDPSK